MSEEPPTTQQQSSSNDPAPKQAPAPAADPSPSERPIKTELIRGSRPPGAESGTPVEMRQQSTEQDRDRDG
jgi:hypothetical protein